MQDSRRFSWKARLRSFRYAGAGIRTLIADEHNARIHCVAAIVAVTLGFALHISSLEWCAVIILIGAVFALEAVNTAVEAIADKVSPQYDELIGKAKDTAAAAVLIMALAAIIAGGIIFIPRILALVANSVRA